MRVLVFSAAIAASSTVLLPAQAGAQRTPTPPAPDRATTEATTEATIDELADRAQAACVRGEQGQLIACGYTLRTLAPESPLARLILAIGHGSLGPHLARDVARQAFDRVLDALAQPLDPEILARMLALVGIRRSDGAAALRTRVHVWQRQLEGGEPLLLAPDRATLARLDTRLRRRADQIAGSVAAEARKLARLRQRRQVAERALQRERRREFRPGEGIRDLQPYVDVITACRRDIAASERRRRAHQSELDALRQRIERVGARLSQLQSASEGRR